MKAERRERAHRLGPLLFLELGAVAVELGSWLEREGIPDNLRGDIIKRYKKVVAVMDEVRGERW